MNYVSAREGVPVPTKPYERAGRAEWVACGCGLKHRPGAFHICIDLSEPAPVVAPKPPPPRDPRVIEREKEAARLYAAGAIMSEVAEQLGMSRSGVASMLQRSGVPIRQPGRRKGTA